MYEKNQATAFPGMGPTPYHQVADFMTDHPYARDLVALADDVLGHDLLAHYRDSPTDYSAAAQVAFLVNCLASARWAEHEQGVRPALLAGASFGAKAAAIRSGALDAADGIWLTAQIARLETEYFADHHGDLVTLSFVRTPRPELDRILDELADWHEISCHIDDDFFMVTVRRDKLEWLRRRLRAAGGLPLYDTDPPMHVSLFGDLRDRVAAELLPRITIRDPELPVVADYDGSHRTTADGIRAMLLDGLVTPVHWPEVVRSLRAAGITRLCVAGPDALFGRVGVTRRAFEVVAASPRSAMHAGETA
ncbi:ACP S-malonyltransferase [Streptomyces sp. NPDC051987]|uniref:ACP S-malonyltransferase n=1 Tax=Streptomyces sp. NPDC051987 TaxID=3155808 RepID=UPI00342C6C58